MHATVGAFKRLSENGSRIRFLTSTKKGMTIFPFSLKGLHKDWSSGPVVLQEIQHGDRVTGFNLRKIEYLFELYTWSPEDAAGEFPNLWSDSLDIDIGEWVGTPYQGVDTPHLTFGFHDPEKTTGDRTVRWTSQRTVLGVYVNKPTGDLQADIHYLDIHRPPNAPPPDPTFLFNGHMLTPIFTGSPESDDLKIAKMVIPNDYVLHITNVLVISCQPWVPSEYLPTRDSRKLGVMIDRVRICPVPKN
jgi:hypothetical protein